MTVRIRVDVFKLPTVSTVKRGYDDRLMSSNTTGIRCLNICAKSSTAMLTNLRTHYICWRKLLYPATNVIDRSNTVLERHRYSAKCAGPKKCNEHALLLQLSGCHKAVLNNSSQTVSVSLLRFSTAEEPLIIDAVYSGLYKS